MIASKVHVPIYIVNEHNEAFFYWQAARKKGCLPGELDLYHIDAHDDMGRPVQFRESLYFQGNSAETELDYYRRFASSELTIANFIFPAVLNGLIRNVYFIFPKWRKYKSVRRKFSVCSAFGEGKVLKYSIQTGEAANPLVARSYPDLKRFRFFSMHADKLPKRRKVILDIDMDYFACRDSIQNQMSFELEITREQFVERDVFLADRTLPYSGLDFAFAERDGRCFIKVEKKRGKDYFHLPSQEEIESEIDSLIKNLVEKEIRPAVVTICRSCNSGYCPDEYSRFIEPLLIEKLSPLVERSR